jgi:hypothetical protein
MHEQSHYGQIVETTNRALRTEFGHTGLCILASVVLLEVLERLDIPAQPLRVEAVVYPPPGGPREHFPCALGSGGDGTRRASRSQRSTTSEPDGKNKRRAPG